MVLVEVNEIQVSSLNIVQQILMEQQLCPRHWRCISEKDLVFGYFCLFFKLLFIYLFTYLCLFVYFYLRERV